MKSLLVILLIFTVGCVFCESPYIKAGNTCCLDEDVDGSCDNQTIEIIEPEIMEKEVDLFRVKAKDSYIESTKLRPFDIDFYVSTPQYTEIAGARFGGIPRCENDHEITIDINGDKAGTSLVTCGSEFSIDIQKKDIKVGENSIGLISTDAPFLIENVTIILGDSALLEMGNLVLEGKKSRLYLSRKNNVVLQNYYELEFEIDDAIYEDIIFFIEPDNDWKYLVYLNDVFIQESKGAKNITLSKDKLKTGSNILRYVLDR